jgi:radical SAM protein with 4Fe4S-binding SPASM domain
MSGKTRYYRRLFSLYRNFRRGSAVVPSPPLRLWLELSSRCNLRCLLCPNKDLPAGQKGDMDWPLFKKAVDQAVRFAHEVNLHHRGETLLHPQAGRFIRYAVAAGLSCRLHTNGTLLNGEVAGEILDSGLQRLSVSLDGFGAAAYERSRRGASFEQVTGNIAAFLERRRRLGRRFPRLTVEVMELTQAAAAPEERREFARRFRRLGLDELASKRPHNWAGHLGAPAASSPITACTFPWSALVILFDGRVVPCPQDFFGAMRLGEAADQALLDIWNGPALQQLRRAHAARELGAFPTCRACDRIRRPTLAGVPREYLDRFVRGRMP